MFFKPFYQRTPWGGWKKEGGGTPHEWHPSQKGALDPPSYGTFSTPPLVSVLCFSCTKKIHDRVDQKLFWRGPEIFGRARSLVRFPPPIRFAPPHITAQFLEGPFSTVAGCPKTARLPYNGRFPSLMGRFLTLMGRFPFFKSPQRGPAARGPAS